MTINWFAWKIVTAFVSIKKWLCSQCIDNMNKLFKPHYGLGILGYSLYVLCKICKIYDIIIF